MNHLKHIDETSPTASDSLYGLSKLTSEKIIEEYCKANNIECQILRLGVMYGNNLGYSGLIPTFIQNILQGTALTIYGDGATQRNFVLVDDVCRAIYQAIIQPKIIHPIVNVVNHKNISVRKLVNILQKLCDKQPTIEYKKQTGQAEDITFDTQVLKQFFPQEMTSYENGLKKSYLFFKGLK